MLEEDSESDISNKEFDVEDIVNERFRKMYNQKKGKYITRKEYLVKWLGYKKMTWEPEENLSNCPLILEKYLKRKKIENNSKNMIYNQLLKLSKCQLNNFSYKNFGPSFKTVLNVDATVTKEEKKKKNFAIMWDYALLNNKSN